MANEQQESIQEGEVLEPNADTGLQVQQEEVEPQPADQQTRDQGAAEGSAEQKLSDAIEYLTDRVTNLETTLAALEPILKRHGIHLPERAVAEDAAPTGEANSAQE